MKKILPLIALALAGCQTTKYISRPCISQDQLTEIKQAEPPKVGDRLNGKADEDIRIIAGSNLRLRAWGNGAVRMLETCAG